VPAAGGSETAGRPPAQTASVRRWTQFGHQSSPFVRAYSRSPQSGQRPSGY